MNQYLYPEWSSPANVNAVSTTRLPGRGRAPFDHFNLGMHVGDDPQVVESHRELLASELGLPGRPQWLNQVHGSDICYVLQSSPAVPTADGAWTDQPGCVLAVMTADCLPVLLTSTTGNCVAVIHGGWRSLLAGVVQKTVRDLPAAPDELLAWLGPAIGPQAFEVGAEVKEAFVEQNRGFASCFRAGAAAHKHYADIFSIGRHCLNEAGVGNVVGGGCCTFQDQKRFFSHRRDSGKTGRMASLIWMV